ncbi:hypothetical protein [Corynebacterium ulceribovis]|uniref:hypothetical protein n=1 Tax=Corynebacterium ulceribovis TaxID=487732 RepID=UPI000367AC5A|nr:hypothetical protein [Corynebacterium ulceribovis]
MNDNGIEQLLGREDWPPVTWETRFIGGVLVVLGLLAGLTTLNVLISVFSL